MSVDQSKKNICGYCVVEWWVKPNNIEFYFLVFVVDFWFI